MYKIEKLPNRLEVITAPTPGTKTVTVLVMVATGSRFENKEASGISHFLEHMFFKGTVKRPTTLAISSELDRVGGEFNAFTGKEYTGFYVKVEASQLELALNILSDVLLNSKFETQEIEREKGVIIEELNMYLDNPLYYVEDLFESCLYGDTPAGRDTIGERETILKFNRRSLLAYLSHQYSAGETVVCLSGKFMPEAVFMVKKYFSKFSNKNYRDKLKTIDTQDRPNLKFHFKTTDQAHLSLGVRAPSFAQDDELITKIISIILGGTMSSRLFTELREKRGLAYYVRTHNEPYTDSGYLTTQAGVPIKKLGLAIKIILDGYAKLAGETVRAEELNRVKQYLIGRNAIHLESSDNLANWYGRQAILLKEQKTGGEILTPEKYYTGIKKITAKDISRVAKKIFLTKHLNLAVIGPYKKFAQFQKLLKL
jgi:predicted Zn-dependent peptidase